MTARKNKSAAVRNCMRLRMVIKTLVRLFHQESKAGGNHRAAGRFRGTERSSVLAFLIGKNPVLKCLYEAHPAEWPDQGLSVELAAAVWNEDTIAFVLRSN
ncbi:uncharacterized protein LOC134203785 [Armigeres subalbatus]|uniref:uncharacterized protein LOC134203785 n=1 Tax=Armigeres subalbatus TaxID=124917 RepID=UPI002ED6171E